MRKVAVGRLSRGRVLQAAVQLADEHGIESVTMRRLAEAIGSEAMSLYYHVTNKEDVLLRDVVPGRKRGLAGWVMAGRRRRGSCRS